MRFPLLRTTLVAALLALSVVTAATAAPTFSNYAGPTDLAGDAGEPSIGNNPATDATFFQSYVTTLKVSGFDGAGHATWTDVTEPTAAVSLDPILWTDRDTGRTFTSHLLLACSKAMFSDDDGGTWLPSQGCGIGTGIDHQTIGGGPFAGLLHDNPIYPDAVYYCTQNEVRGALCATSYDGGITFGPAVEAYNFDDCPGVYHGHMKVDLNGTAYLPTSDCHGHQTLAESTDNGTTYTLDEVPDSTSQRESDPHLGIGDKGTLYFGWEGADGTDLGDQGYLGHAFSEGRAWISVKPAGSNQWRPKIDVGAPFGVKNIQFPEVWAGDDNRAAYAFLGTTTAGDDQNANFKGAWDLYVAFTYDGGLTWTTVDATPTDPVQRGCIWLQGGSSKCRNLLDFNDITIDKQGRVMVAYADGCTGACVTNANDYKDKTALGVIARQESGLGLLSAFDSTLGAAPAVKATKFSAKVKAPPAKRHGDDR
jgi:hypothetical protein